jgi:hypothetical protein
VKGASLCSGSKLVEAVSGRLAQDLVEPEVAARDGTAAFDEPYPKRG